MSYSISVSQCPLNELEGRLHELMLTQPVEQRADCTAAILHAVELAGCGGARTRHHFGAGWVNCSIQGHAEPDPDHTRPGWSPSMMTISLSRAEPPERVEDTVGVT